MKSQMSSDNLHLTPTTMDIYHNLHALKPTKLDYFDHMFTFQSNSTLLSSFLVSLYISFHSFFNWVSFFYLLTLLYYLCLLKFRMMIIDGLWCWIPLFFTHKVEASLVMWGLFQLSSLVLILLVLNLQSRMFDPRMELYASFLPCLFFVFYW